MQRYNHTPSRIVMQFLVEQGLVCTAESGHNWPCYYDHFPDTPNNAVCVRSVEGIVMESIQITGEIQEENGIQVEVRGTEGDKAYIKARQIKDAFDTNSCRVDVDLGPYTYLIHDIRRIGEVHRLGYDPDTSRWRYTLNALALLEDLTDDFGDTGTGTD